MSERSIIQRVLQYKGRRYPLRLEQGFWTALDQISRKKGRRLNSLVAELADADPAPVNLAGAVREFSVVEMMRQANHARVGLGGSRIDLILNSAPAPGFLIDDDRILIDCNDAFLDWSRGQRSSLLGNRLEDIFRCDVRNMTKGWALMQQGKLDLLQCPLVYLSPGRLSSAQASICPVNYRLDQDMFSETFLVWLSAGKKQG